jgi:glutathione S-transferase
MYRLFYYPGNASMTPHMALEEIGAPFELNLVDRDNNGHKSAEYLRLNPNGLIPVLVDGDLVLYETAAICLHLGDRHPESGLVPSELGSPARAHLYKWLIHLTNTLQPELITYYYPDREADDAAAAARVKTHAERRVGEIMGRIEAALGPEGPYLLGRRFSVADLYLFMLARWTRGMASPARTRPAIRKLCEFVTERPAVRRALATEGIAAPFF